MNKTDVKNQWQKEEDLISKGFVVCGGSTIGLRFAVRVERIVDSLTLNPENKIIKSNQRVEKLKSWLGQE